MREMISDNRSDGMENAIGGVTSAVGVAAIANTSNL